MVSEIKDASSFAAAQEIWIPEFGLLHTQHLEAGKRYQGRLYRLNAETAKSISDIAGFNARFDLPGIRTAVMDLFKTEAHFVFEIERNIKPADISVRYMRDRWNVQDVAGRGADGLRPWIKSEYRARFLAEKVFAAIAEQIKVKPDGIQRFFIRVNFKDKTLGLITDEKNIEALPAGSYAGFGLPQQTVTAVEISDPDEVPVSNMVASSEARPEEETIPETTPPTEARTEIVQDRSNERASANRQGTNVREPEAQAKYATYSRSEIDHMLKQQAEAISNALGSKISAQQRTFQEAVAAQEKAFSRLSDNFMTQFDTARTKLEKTATTSQEKTTVELDEFKKSLAKELEQYRTQINKIVAPIAKSVEERPTKTTKKEPEKSTAAAALSSPSTNLRIWFVTLIVLSVINAALAMTNQSTLSDLQSKVDRLTGKLK